MTTSLEGIIDDLCNIMRLTGDARSTYRDNLVSHVRMHGAALTEQERLAVNRVATDIAQAAVAAGAVPPDRKEVARHTARSMLVAFATGFGPVTAASKFAGNLTPMGSNAVWLTLIGGPLILFVSEILAGRIRARGPNVPSEDLQAYMRIGTLRNTIRANSIQGPASAWRAIEAEADNAPLRMEIQRICVNNLLKREFGKALGIRKDGHPDVPDSRWFNWLLRSGLTVDAHRNVRLPDGTFLFRWDGQGKVTWGDDGPTGDQTDLLNDPVPETRRDRFHTAVTRLTKAATIRSLIVDDFSFVSFVALYALSGGLGPYLRGLGLGGAIGDVLLQLAMCGVSIQITGQLQDSGRLALCGTRAVSGMDSNERAVTYETNDLKVNLLDAKLRVLQGLVQQINGEIKEKDNEREHLEREQRPGSRAGVQGMPDIRQELAELRRQKTLYLSNAKNVMKQLGAAKAARDIAASSEAVALRTSAKAAYRSLGQNWPQTVARNIGYLLTFVFTAAVVSRFIASRAPWALGLLLVIPFWITKNNLVGQLGEAGLQGLKGILALMMASARDNASPAAKAWHRLGEELLGKMSPQQYMAIEGVLSRINFDPLPLAYRHGSPESYALEEAILTCGTDIKQLHLAADAALAVTDDWGRHLLHSDGHNTRVWQLVRYISEYHSPARVWEEAGRDLLANGLTREEWDAIAAVLDRIKSDPFSTSPDDLDAMQAELDQIWGPQRATADGTSDQLARANAAAKKLLTAAQGRKGLLTEIFEDKANAMERLLLMISSNEQEKRWYVSALQLVTRVGLTREEAHEFAEVALKVEDDPSRQDVAQARMTRGRKNSVHVRHAARKVSRADLTRMFDPKTAAVMQDIARIEAEPPIQELWRQKKAALLADEILWKHEFEAIDSVLSHLEWNILGPAPVDPDAQAAEWDEISAALREALKEQPKLLQNVLLINLAHAATRLNTNKVVPRVFDPHAETVARLFTGIGKAADEALKAQDRSDEPPSVSRGSAASLPSLDDAAGT